MDKKYNIYFELSGIPLQAGRTIFEKEWKALNPSQSQMWSDVNIYNSFLIVHCTLGEIVDRYFPLLKKTVDSTNMAYRGYTHDMAVEHRHRIDIWTDERKAADNIAKLLKFE